MCRGTECVCKSMYAVCMHPHICNNKFTFILNYHVIYSCNDWACALAFEQGRTTFTLR